MAITFHCDHCGRKIEAQDGSAGKWGKCPACHNKIYVPNLNPEEELKLAPVDESDEAKQKQLMDETYKLAQDILLERDPPDEMGKTKISAPEISDEELTKNIILYLRQVADGELDEAQITADLIIPYSVQAVKISSSP